MNEAAAQRWLIDELNVPRETIATLSCLCDLVTEESTRQNLVAQSTLAALWSRHVVDSAQLLPLLATGSLLDIGSGAGFPGLVIAIIGGRPLTLVEPRRKRAEFLAANAAALGLSIEVRQARVETIAARPFGTIVARAVAPLDALFAAASHLADADTRWVLPKGRRVESELAAARETWQGDFKVVPSITDPDAAIVVAERVRRKVRR